MEMPWQSAGAACASAAGVTALIWLVSVAPWVGVFAGVAVVIMLGLENNRVEDELKSAQEEKVVLMNEVVALRTVLQGMRQAEAERDYARRRRGMAEGRWNQSTGSL